MRRERLKVLQLCCGCGPRRDMACSLGDLLWRFGRFEAWKRHIREMYAATLMPRRGPRRRFEIREAS